MDKYPLWDKLNLMQLLNCVCDTLAKRALTQTILLGYHNRSTQTLLQEDVVLVIWGNKVTGDISQPLLFYASKEVAQSYLRNCPKDKWRDEHFDEVDWEHLN
jgi:hypothetical protein